MTGLVLILYGISFILGILMLVRVFRASVLDGLLCLFLPFWNIVVLIKYWKDPDHDIKLYFFGQIVVIGVAVMLLTRLDHQTARRDGTLQTASADAGDSSGASAPIDSAPARPAASRNERPGSGSASASAPRSREPDTPARAQTAEELAPPPLRVVLRAVTFQHGGMERSSAGFQLVIPDHFRGLSATDAHRLEASMRQTPDIREIAWVAHESVALDAPDAWHVSVRWLPDGWVAGSGMLDPWQLLKAAQHATSGRLAGSGGDLIGYAVAPSAEDGVYNWVEERLPAGAPASVLDCHAIKLARRGVLEFTVAGQPVGTQQLCGATVRLLARHARFDPDADYTAAPPDSGPRAGYALADLIAGTH